jgi:3',5'-cyclic AMP phosphodiesterase CpdA
MALVAQLSDLHVTGSRDDRAALGLRRAVDALCRLDPRPDTVVLTGDLADSGAVEEYADVRDAVAAVGVPVHVAAGNHDSTDAMVSVFGGTAFLGGGRELTYRVDYDDVAILVLDSHIPGANGGRLGEQLGWLDAALDERPETPALVCFHHPPVPLGWPGLDAIGLADAAELAVVLGRHRNVARVTAGHAHRAVYGSLGGVGVSVAPSTYRQGALDLRPTGGLGYSDEPTGFLLHLIDGDGCATHVMPTPEA